MRRLPPNRGQNCMPVHNWHRHYDPTLGRYTRPDPLGFVDGPSVYAYAGSSPGMITDQLGLAKYGTTPPNYSAPGGKPGTLQPDRLPMPDKQPPPNCEMQYAYCISKINKSIFCLHSVIRKLIQGYCFARYIACKTGVRKIPDLDGPDFSGG